MRKHVFDRFGLEHLRLADADPPQPGPHEIALDVKAISLNYRDLLVLTGGYNPKLKLPATPISDGAGLVAAVGEDVSRGKVGQRVVSHFVTGWIDGRFRGEYLNTTLGTPKTGLAAERVVLPAEAVLPIPPRYDFEQAATWPIAALTAWSALVTEGRLETGQTVLTLGTGGVSIFALQIAKAMGATVIITSSSDEKLARARALGADHTVNYRRHTAWHKQVLESTDGRGADIVVENGGIATLAQSLDAARPGGTIALLGALTGLHGETDIAPLLMKRIRIAGILVDSRAAFEDMLAFFEQHALEPLIDARFEFERLPDALRHMQSAAHFGKIVVSV